MKRARADSVDREEVLAFFGLISTQFGNTNLVI
jgi:hypothetical protein